MSVEPRDFVALDEVGEVVALACTPDGRVLGVNNRAGRVWFYAVEGGATRRLPLALDRSSVAGVLLVPDGRVVSYRAGATRTIEIHDPETAALLRRIELARAEPATEERPIEDVSVALLERAPTSAWSLILHFANAERSPTVDWFSTWASDLCDAHLGQDRLTRMALHPNHRYLAVLGRAIQVVDLDSGALVASLPRGIEQLAQDNARILDVGFDAHGLLTITGATSGGNPDVQFSVERVELESGDLESTTEYWAQHWGDFLEGDGAIVYSHDPASLLPPDRIPTGTYKVLIRQACVELWSRTGLVRSVTVEPRTCVLPSFDPAEFCRAPKVLLLAHAGSELVDLVSGERWPWSPPVELDSLTWIEFDAARQRTLVWQRRKRLLVAPLGDARWTASELPGPRQVREWACASAAGLVFVADDAERLWVADVELAPCPAEPPPVDLRALQRELDLHPHEPAPFLVYADALIERGDPRGELIVLQHQRDFDEADALLRRHPHALLGSLAALDPDAYELRWELGHVRHASFRIGADALGRVLAFLGSDVARLLESLELRLRPRWRFHNVDSDYRDIDAYLAAARHLPLLSSIQLGDGKEHPLSDRLVLALLRRLRK